MKYFLNSDVQWSTDGCQLLSTNLTHSLCSCNHLSTFALFTDFPKVTDLRILIYFFRFVLADNQV